MAEYIDRDKLLEDFERMEQSNKFVTWDLKPVAFWAAVQDAPTADVVEVKHGKWIEKENNYDTYYDCSVCGESFVFIEGEPIDNLYYFCPNCGAKMDGEHNER